MPREDVKTRGRLKRLRENHQVGLEPQSSVWSSGWPHNKSAGRGSSLKQARYKHFRDFFSSQREG
jgi:hypothetical protein